jgi:hypothetical protein
MEVTRELLIDSINSVSEMSARGARRRSSFSEFMSDQPSFNVFKLTELEYSLIYLHRCPSAVMRLQAA